MKLEILNYANGDFEVIHNGVKTWIQNFWYTKKHGEYFLPCGAKHIYQDNELIQIIYSDGSVIYKDKIYTPKRD